MFFPNWFWAGLTVLAVTTSDHARASTMMSAGINLSGLESNSSVLPGRANYDYAIPSDKELAYYQSKGVMVVRLPVLWARLQPNLLSATQGTALDPAYLGYVITICKQAAARKMEVVVDIHNYGGYATHKIGDGVLTQLQFAEFWSLLALRLKGTPGLGGYDLMNEPSKLSSAGIWPAAAQAAITAIRKVDMSTVIFVEGDFYASAPSWLQYNSNLRLADPAKRLVYEAHVYGDRDSSGTHFDWNTEASYGVTVDTIADRIAAFADWCSTKDLRCIIGEVGVGNDNANWNTELAHGLAAMKRSGISGFAYWAGGPWWGTYPMSIEPTVGGDAKQMSVITKYRD